MKIDRFVEIPSSGPMCDLMWSDPCNDFDELDQEKFSPNESRGCSYSYGFKAVCTFLEDNDLLSLIRAHEAQSLGYKMQRKNSDGFPSVITIFSAPNYIDSYKNKAAILNYENDSLNVKTFSHSPHPYWLPSFMNVFEWSIPFVTEKLTQFLLSILRLIDKDEEKELEQEEEWKARKIQLKRKIQSVSKIMSLYSEVTNENNQIVQNSSYLPSQTFTKDSLNNIILKRSTAPSILFASFDKAKFLDSLNEKRPEIEVELKSKTLPSFFFLNK